MDFARSLEVRTQGNPRTVASEIRKVIAGLAPELPIQDVSTLAERVNRLLAQERLIAELTGLFGFLALLLACIGIYGLISYAVVRRMPEMGIRMALGARRADVLRIVALSASVSVGLGLALGAALSLGAGKFVARWVESGTHDPLAGRVPRHG